MTRLPALVLLASALQVVAPPSASAAYNVCSVFKCETSQYVYGGNMAAGIPCVYIDTAIDDNHGSPHMFTNGYITNPGPPCHNTAVTGGGQGNWSRVDVIQILMYWKPGLSQWQICNVGPWETTDDYITESGVFTEFAWPSPPCGAGYYGDIAGAYYSPPSVPPGIGPWFGANVAAAPVGWIG